jgi:hypothetical protein
MTWFFLYPWLLLRIAYHELALRQIDPTHPDVPYIIHHLSWLRDRLARLNRRTT